MARETVQHDVCVVGLTYEQAGAVTEAIGACLGLLEGEAAKIMIVRSRVKPLREAGPILTDIVHPETAA